MRRQWQRRAGQAALLALFLQLVLPLVTVHRATAAPGPGGPFVICTAAGLVWIDPGAGAVGGDAPDGEPEPAHHCPICFTKQLAAAALLPLAPPLQKSSRHKAAFVPSAPTFRPRAGSAPPLPPRGPPRVA